MERQTASGGGTGNSVPGGATTTPVTTNESTETEKTTDEGKAAPEKVTVTFVVDGAAYSTVEVEKGAALGDKLPADPTKEGFTFTGWTADGAPFTKETVVKSGTTVTAGWTENVVVVSQQNPPEAPRMAAPKAKGTSGDASLTLSACFYYNGQEYYPKGAQANTATLYCLGTGGCPYHEFDLTEFHTNALKQFSKVEEFDGKGLKVKTWANSDNLAQEYELTNSKFTTSPQKKSVKIYYIVEKDSSEYTTVNFYDGKAGNGSAWWYATMENVVVGSKLTTFPSEDSLLVPEGHTFTGWYMDVGADGYGVGTRYTDQPVTKDMCLYSGYTVNQYTVTFDPKGGTLADGTEKLTVTHGQTIDTMPADPSYDDNHIFKGWVDENGKEVTGSTVVTSNMTVSAQWDEIYTLEASAYPANSGARVTVTPEANHNINGKSAYPTGTVLTLTATNPTVAPGPGNKWEFKGWKESDTQFVEGMTEQTATLTMPANDYQIFAVFEQVPLAEYTVSFNANGGSGEMKPQQATEGTPFTVPNSGFAAPDDKVFIGWKIEGDATDTLYPAGESIEVTADVTLVAQWDVDKTGWYTVTFTSDGKEISKETVKPGSTVTFPNSAELSKDDCWFFGWKDQDGKEYQTDALPSDLKVEKDMEFDAIWIPLNITFKITYNTTGGAFTEGNQDWSISPERTWEYSTNVTSLIPVKKNCTFKGWTADPKTETPDPNYATGEVVNLTWRNPELTLYAVWEETITTDKYTVSVSSNNGTPSGSGTYEAGKQINVSVTAPAQVAGDNKTWDFDGWTGMEFKNPSELKQSFTMPGSNVTLTANFTQKEDLNNNEIPDEDETYTVTVTAKPDTAKVEGGGSYKTGDKVTVKVTTPTAAPSNGKEWVFKGWTAKGLALTETEKYAETLSFKMPAKDVELEAVFEEEHSAIAYKIEFYDRGNMVNVEYVAEGKTLDSLPDPDRSGYWLKGWYSKTGGKGYKLTTDTELPGKFPVRDGNIIKVYAYWIKTDSTNPKTSDDSNIFLWTAILCLATAGLAGAAAYTLRTKKRR
ncbi:MAG: InlB B-repeat-containing protein [Eubacteriales bacterium]|nr:InlB B-repeat-containing protein [Eubacteriales bacterium]